MAREKSWDLIGPIAFTAAGTSEGKITLPSTKGFHVKQKVRLDQTGSPSLNLEVKLIISETEMFLGPAGGIDLRKDLSTYNLGDTIYADRQPRPSIPEKEFERAVYEEEPAVAKRTILVDRLGNYYELNNPLPVQLSDGSIEIGTVNAQVEVQLSHTDNFPEAGDVHDSVRVGDGQHILDINADGSINVNLVDVTPGTKITYTEAATFTDTSETLVGTFNTSLANTIISKLTLNAQTLGIWRIYKGSIDPANLLEIERTSPFKRTGRVDFNQWEAFNIGENVIITFQAERYRSSLIGVSAETFIRIEGNAS